MLLFLSDCRFLVTISTDNGRLSFIAKLRWDEEEEEQLLTVHNYLNGENMSLTMNSSNLKAIDASDQSMDVDELSDAIHCDQESHVTKL